MIQTGVGSSTKRSAHRAGAEAAAAAIAALEGRKAGAVVVFANPGYDQHALLGAIREVAGPRAAVSGCSSEAVLHRGERNADPCAVVVMAIASPAMTAVALSASGLRDDPVGCGAVLGAQVHALGPERARAVLLFPDGVSGDCAAAVHAFERAVPFPLQIAGGGAGDLRTRRVMTSFQYTGSAVATDSVSALVLGGAIAIEIALEVGGPQRAIARPPVPGTPPAAAVLQLDATRLGAAPPGPGTPWIGFAAFGAIATIGARARYGDDAVVRWALREQR